jgi:hypothetical protein
MFFVGQTQGGPANTGFDLREILVGQFLKREIDVDE